MSPGADETRTRAVAAPTTRGQSSSRLRRTGGVRFPLVDSLRAIAALSVFVFHIGGAAFPPHAVAIFTSRLNVGVTLFFVISGFLLYRPFVAARFIRGRHALGPGRYAWHRFLRIVPAYWVALTVVALWLGLPHVFGPDAIVYYGFGQVYGFRTLLGGIGQAWTLSIEVAFYVFLPFWAWAIARIPARTAERRLRVELIALALLFVFSLVYKPVIHGVTGLSPNLWFALDNALPVYLDQFAIGMVLAVASVWFETHDAPDAVKVIDERPWLSWGLAAIALTVLATQFGKTQNELGSLAVHYLDALIALGLFLPAVFGTAGRGWVRRFLGHPVLIWIGVVSYGFYLYHQAVVLQVARWGGLGTGLGALFLWTLVCVGPVLALAAASWYGVERTALRYKGMAPPAWLRRLTRSGTDRTEQRHPDRGVRARSHHRLDRREQRDQPSGGGDRDRPAARAVCEHLRPGLGIRRRHLQLTNAAAVSERSPDRQRSRQRPARTHVRLCRDRQLHRHGAKWDGPLKYVAVYRSALTAGADPRPLCGRLGRMATVRGRAAGRSSRPICGVTACPRSVLPDPARPPRWSQFSLEAWVKAYSIVNRVVVDLPGEWSLQTDLDGHWRAGVIVRGRPFDAISRVAPPRQAARH